MPKTRQSVQEGQMHKELIFSPSSGEAVPFSFSFLPLAFHDFSKNILLELQGFVEP